MSNRLAIIVLSKRAKAARLELPGARAALKYSNEVSAFLLKAGYDKVPAILHRMAGAAQEMLYVKGVLTKDWMDCGGDD